MTKIKSILIPAALLLLTAACSTDAENGVPEAGRIPIRLSSAMQTRAGQSVQDTQFEVSENIDVLIESQDGVTTYDAIQYVMTDDAGTMAPSKGIYPYYPVNQSKVDITAIYPSGYTKKSQFEVKTSQELTVNYKASDLMFAYLKDLSPTDETKVLQFRHKLSKICVNLTAEGGVDLTDAVVKLLNVRTKTTFDLDNDTVSYESATGSTTTVTMTRDGSIDCAAIIVPQTVQSGYLLEIALKNNDVLNYRTAQTMTFESGKKYTYNIKVVEANIQVSATVSDWAYDEDEDQQGNVKLP